MLKTYLNTKLSSRNLPPITDTEWPRVCRMTRSDIRSNKLFFGTRTTLDYVLTVMFVAVHIIRTESL